MSKKKTQNKPEELETVAETTATVLPPELSYVQTDYVPKEPITYQVIDNTPIHEPVVQHQVVKTPKKRIRIRKKATKKLSAAILIKDPTITRFI